MLLLFLFFFLLVELRFAETNAFLALGGGTERLDETQRAVGCRAGVHNLVAWLRIHVNEGVTP